MSASIVFFKKIKCLIKLIFPIRERKKKKKCGLHFFENPKSGFGIFSSQQTLLSQFPIFFSLFLAFFFLQNSGKSVCVAVAFPTIVIRHFCRLSKRGKKYKFRGSSIMHFPFKKRKKRKKNNSLKIFSRLPGQRQ